MNNYRLGFIGAGKLAGSVMRGLIRANFCPAGAIIASEPNESARESLRRDTGIDLVVDNVEVAEKAETILIGLKPGLVGPIVRDLAAHLKDKLVISLAAGTRLSAMESIAHARFMRAMTNTPSPICRAATALAPGTRTTNADV